MRSIALTGLMISMTLTVASPLQVLAGDSKPGNLMQNWLATGIITRIDNNAIYMLGKDNHIYRIDTKNAQYRMENTTEQTLIPDVGDKIRVFGRQTAPTEVKARQIFISTSPKPTPYTPPPPVEPPCMPAIPAGPGAGPKPPQAIPPFQPPNQPEQLETIWTNRGFISDISFRDKTLMLQTSRGLFSVEVGNAPVTDGRTSMVLSDLSVGDAVRIYGDIVGLSKVRADQVVLLRLRTDIENQLPIKPTAMRGEILNVDYPSFIFRMQTDYMVVNVLVDDNTRVTMHGKTMAFMDLKPGATVKVDGVGTPAAGFVAQNIFIVSVPPR